MGCSLRDLNNNTTGVRWWMESSIKRQIRDLPWYSEDALYGQFNFLATMCDDTGMDFWRLVHEVGGEFAIRVLIHAIKVVKGKK